MAADANDLVILTDAGTTVSQFETLPSFGAEHLQPVEGLGPIRRGQRNAAGPGTLAGGAHPLLHGDRNELNRAKEAILQGIAAGSDPRETIHVDFEGANWGKRFSIRNHRGHGGAAGAGH